MKMRKLLISLASIVLAAAGLGATETEKVNYVTNSYDCKNFTGISVSGVVQVNLVKSNTYKVKVTLPEELESYMTVRVTGKNLRIHLSNVPQRISRKYRGETWGITAEVAMPMLESLEMSGATRFECEDRFDIGDRTFALDISGASKVTALDVRASRLDADISGAGYASIKGKFSKASLDLSGAAKMNFPVSAEKLNLDLSGASKCSVSGDYDFVDVDLSGACGLVLEGSARKLSVDASGVAQVKAPEFIAQEVNLDLTGACGCEVNATKKLSIDASGSAGIKYVDNPGLDLNVISAGRGTSIKKTH